MADDAATPSGQLSPPGGSDGPEVEAHAQPAADIDVDIDPDADFDANEAIDADNVDHADDASGAATTEGVKAKRRSIQPVTSAVVAGLVTVLALGGLSGWLGYRAYQAQQIEEERELYLQVARQGAINLTTIDYQNADADIQRILDSATGQFYDDFSQRSQPFVDVVKQAQSKSTGTVTEAGLESVTDDQADAIVSVAVKTSNAGAPEQQPRLWRMRVTIQRMGEDVKVSNVGFVP
jgi:Mce-associated membrane protein